MIGVVYFITLQKGESDEEDFSATQQAEEKNTWIQSEDADKGREKGFEEEKKKGKKEAGSNHIQKVNEEIRIFA